MLCSFTRGCGILKDFLFHVVFFSLLTHVLFPACSVHFFPHVLLVLLCCDFLYFQTMVDTQIFLLFRSHSELAQVRSAKTLGHFVIEKSSVGSWQLPNLPLPRQAFLRKRLGMAMTIKAESEFELVVCVEHVFLFGVIFHSNFKFDVN